MTRLKAKTRCNACDQLGHWTGDQECPKSAGKGNKGKPRVHFGSSSGHSGSNIPNNHGKAQPRNGKAAGLSGKMASELPNTAPICQTDGHECDRTVKASPPQKESPSQNVWIRLTDDHHEDENSSIRLADGHREEADVQSMKSNSLDGSSEPDPDDLY